MEVISMSKPHPPYYYKKDSDTYHWETSCSNNFYPAEGWVKSYTVPSGREQCNKCKEK
jgi:hypothetical protein